MGMAGWIEGSGGLLDLALDSPRPAPSCMKVVAKKGAWRDQTTEQGEEADWA